MPYIFLSLFLLSCSSPKAVSLEEAQCYLYIGSEAVQIRSEGEEAYLFSYFNGQPIFYWEHFAFIERAYLPIPCSKKIIKEAKQRLPST